MLIFALLLAGAVVCFAVYLVSTCELRDTMSFLTAFFCTILVITAAICVGKRAEQVSEIQKVQSIQSTIDESRASGRQIETAALAVVVSEVNANIASARYWDESPWLGWFIVGEYANLEPIK